MTRAALLALAFLATIAPFVLRADDAVPIDRARIERLVDDAVYELKVQGEVMMRMRQKLHFVERDGVEFFCVEESTISEEEILGETIRTEESTTSWYLLTGVGRLHSGESVVNENGNIRTHRIRRLDDGYELSFESESDRGSQPIETLDNNLEQLLRPLEWMLEERSVGDVFRQDTTHWQTPEETMTEVSSYLGSETREFRGEPTLVHRLRVILEGLVLEAVVLPSGQILSAEMSGGFFRYERLEGTALEPLARPFDAGGMVCIPIDVPLGDGERLEELVLVASGIPGGVFEESARQRVTALPNGAHRIEVRAGHLCDHPEPLEEADRLEFTARTSEYPIADERIAELVEEIVEDVESPVAVATLLSDWIFENLEYTVARNAVSAIEVLENRTGDCTEYALLFVALARACSLPSRPVTGVVYCEDEDGAGFFPHAWAEIHDGTRWVTVDPGWKQVGVDAGHVRVNDDNEAVNLMHLYGTFEFELERLARGPALQEVQTNGQRGDRQ